MDLSHLDYEEVIDSVATDLYYGFCTNEDCGASHIGVEPDVREMRCECCMEFSVYGAEELLFMMEG